VLQYFFYFCYHFFFFSSLHWKDNLKDIKQNEKENLFAPVGGSGRIGDARLFSANFSLTA